MPLLDDALQPPLPKAIRALELECTRDKLQQGALNKRVQGAAAEASWPREACHEEHQQGHGQGWVFWQPSFEADADPVSVAPT